MIEKAKKLLQNPENIKAANKRGGKKHLRDTNTQETTWEFDEKKIDQDTRFDGYYTGVLRSQLSKSGVLALMPMAVGGGTGNEMMKPMAIVIAFGLSFSTLITLADMTALPHQAECLGRLCRGKDLDRHGSKMPFVKKFADFPQQPV